jgi:hypothetical protein
MSGYTHAVPNLQLGPDPTDSGAAYDNSTQTWLLGGSGSNDFSFTAYNLGQEGATAYLVFSAVPQLTTDVFDLVVSDDNGSLTLYDSGFGTPPFEDPNSLAPHGIYDTWSEIYEITFDGPTITVPDTQPGTSGTATGYLEQIYVGIISKDAALTGIHIDMFTAYWDAEMNKDIVTSFAPFSHDAEFSTVPLPPTEVPIPAAVWLFGSGLLGLVGISGRKKAA